MTITLTTPRLHLRPLALPDAGAIGALIDDPDIARMLAMVPHPYPQGAARSFIESIRSDQLVLAVCLQNGGLIGCVAATLKPPEARIGYWLGKAFWHKGYMDEALRAFLHRLFQDGTIKKATAGVFADNHASWRLQERIGFRRIGDISLHSLARAGEVPSWETEITREEFLRP